MSLREEIDSKSKEIIAESYGMSLGELITMYRDGDLEIHPEFQRFFRWNNTQKTRLIESFLLNIPVPPIFVSQNEKGIWEVVDGLQRISTILHFAGCYKDENGKTASPLILEATDNLPSLENRTFDDFSIPDTIPFDADERRFLKRARISIIILKKESDSSGKYELFQRLNTGGSSLSDQEVRNCLMVMENKDNYTKLSALATESKFPQTVRINKRLLDMRYDLELISRFFCLRTLPAEALTGVSDFSKFLNKRIVYLFNAPDWDIDEEIRIFNLTFDQIQSALHDEAFCLFDKNSERFVGTTLTPLFEIFAIGLGRIDGILPEGFNFKERVRQFWTDLVSEYPQELPWKRKNIRDRFPLMLQLSEKFYGQNQN